MIHYFSEGGGGAICASGCRTQFSLLSNGDLSTSLVVQWLRHHSYNAGGPSLTSGQGTMGTQGTHATTKSLCSATEGPACLKEDGRSSVLQLRCGRYIYIYIYIHTHTHTHRERQKERDTHTNIFVYTHIHTQIHIHYF